MIKMEVKDDHSTKSHEKIEKNYNTHFYVRM